MNEIDDFLKQCGITETTLSLSEKDSLDRNGYVVLNAVIEPDRINKLHTAFEAAALQAGKATNNKQSGTRHIDDLVNRDAAFEVHV